MVILLTILASFDKGSLWEYNEAKRVYVEHPFI